MRSNTIRSQTDVLRKKIASLNEEKRDFDIAAMKAAKNAANKTEQAMKARSASSHKSYIRQADQERKKATEAERKSNERAKKIALLQEQMTKKEKALAGALRQEQSRADRDTEKRRRDELAHARKISELSKVEVRHVIVPAPQPEKLRILYLTTNPDALNPERMLRTDAEVNAVLKELRGAKYRELVELTSVPAATPKDLMDGINDHRPHVVHFSGHGGNGLLEFDNASLDDPGAVSVGFDLLGEVLSATDTPPVLLVMNACSTLNGSDTLLEAVPTLVAMSDSVGDAAAGVFAAQFYSAIASAQSVGAALRQAKAMLKLSLMREDAELPQIAHRDDIDPDTLQLVTDRN